MAFPVEFGNRAAVVGNRSYHCKNQYGPQATACGCGAVRVGGGGGKRGALRHWGGVAAAVLVLSIGSFTATEHLFDVDLGIHQVLAREAPGAIATTSPNRLGLPGSVSLMLFGTGLIALAFGRRAAIGS
jgi:hypothetical protein